MGHVLDEPVLVLKACIGNRSLGWDLLPPDGERYEYEGKVYAGYKDTAPSWEKGVEPKAVPWYAERQYDADTAHAKAVLKNLKKYFPDYKDQGYEVARFVWRQAADSPANQGYHYNHNAETYVETGLRLGRAMADLLKGDRK